LSAAEGKTLDAQGLATDGTIAGAAEATPTVAGQRSGGLVGLLQGLARGRTGWRLARWSGLLPRIEQLGRAYAGRSDQQLKKESLSLRYRARSGEPLAGLLPEAYALVREAATRSLGMRHFDVQLLGGIALFHDSIAEMETGEGKTLTATLPLYLRALAGKGAHLATVNDYLATRDAQWMGPVYERLGLTVGVVQTEMNRAQRRRAYACDVTYGTAKEFGFDFLRDRLVVRRIRQQRPGFLNLAGDLDGQGGERPVQREPYFVVVDEADSVLIDEARTPLIISAAGDTVEEHVQATYRWSAAHAPQFAEGEHYAYDQEKRKVELTHPGRQLVRALPQPPEMSSVGLLDIYDYVERAIKVQRDFHRDEHYVVNAKEEVVIVDEFTGRLAEGRKWRDGIHQAIEAKEQVEVTVDTGQAARITVQDLFLRYPHLAGMTGTAWTSAREFRKIYRLRVVPVPTNRPVCRRRLPPKIYGTGQQKWTAIVAEVRELHAAGRPVLIGTRSIEKSELLSRLLTAAGVPHQVLNARHVAAEAEIIARAGEPSKVTVATNMAGRGTDIRLGPGVGPLGGLHVVCTEIHDAQRIDRQLAGRCGRQGDPGTVQQYLALDDEIIASGLGPKAAARWKQRGEAAAGQLPKLSRQFRRAQRRVERRHLRERMILLHHEKQRKKMHRELGQDPYLDTPS